MARSAAAIQAEITSIETHLQSSDSVVSSVGSDGTSLSRADRSKLEERLDQLYQQLGRVDGTSPMIVRGRVRNFR